MKNRLLLVCAILSTALCITACGSEPSGKVKVEEEKPALVIEDKVEAADETADENDELEDADEYEDEESSATEEDTSDSNRDKKSDNPSFNDAVAYIKNQGNNQESLNYEKIQYKAAKRNKKNKSSDAYKDIDAKLPADEVKKIRMLREDNTGATMDVTAYIDRSSRDIDKIVTEEYCADGRDVNEYYYLDGDLTYAYNYKLDVYGLTYKGADLPGKKCFFAGDTMTECTIDDADVGYRSVYYTAKDMENINMDDFTRQQYDQMESSLLNKAYMTYDKMVKTPATALIYGYIGDEYGGVLSNTDITIVSKANNFTQEIKSDGDGYFQVRVPINTDDCYGIVCKYGDFADATVDDINICEGTIEYSLGIIYMAEPGNNVHDVNTYLLNANAKSPKSISKDEYCVVVTWEDPAVDLKPFTINMEKGRKDNGTVVVIDANKDNKVYLTDQRGGRSGNPMTYEMSLSRAQVTVYGKDGIVASYRVPVGRAGTVWEVFETVNGEIVPINNYFYDGSTTVFFE